MSEVVLQTRSLVKRFGGIVATNNVSLTVVKGARHALIGPNGAGKTTLINQLTGVMAPSAGRVELLGRDITGLAPHARVALGLVRTFQINQLFNSLTPLQSLAVAVSSRRDAARRWWQPLGSDAAVAEECESLLAQFRLSEHADRPTQELPYGKRRLLEIALAVALKPQVLLLDEPAAGVPAAERADILATVAAYLLGSLSFAVIVSRLMGLKDPRTFGSKNPGATNVLRSGSKAAAVVTLLLDALKGWLPVVLVRWFGKPYGLEDGTVALVGLAAFLGHLWPVFFRFQGGKGVATFIGVVFGVDLLLGLATGATWLIIAYFFRYSSLASLVSAAFAPVFYLMGDRIQWYSERAVLFMLFFMALLLAVRHRENINRLLEGKESKLGAKK